MLCVSFGVRCPGQRRRSGCGEGLDEETVVEAPAVECGPWVGGLKMLALKREEVGAVRVARAVMAMLSEPDLKSLLNILKESTKSFDAIALMFHKRFGKREQFKAGCAVCMLIEDNLLTQTQRLVGFYLLYDIYRHESLPTTPFVPLVVEIVEKTTDEVERKFLLQFLSSLPKELPKQSAQSFLQSCDPAEQVPIPDLDAVRRMHQESAPSVSKANSIGVRPVIKDGSDEGSDGDDLTQSLGLSSEELTLLSLQPAWCRVVPPLLEPTIDETFWLTPPQILSEPLWDYTMCASDWDLGLDFRNFKTL